MLRSKRPALWLVLLPLLACKSASRASDAGDAALDAAAGVGHVDGGRRPDAAADKPTRDAAVASTLDSLLSQPLFGALFLGYNPAWTGVAVHEWLCVITVVPLLFHVVVNWDQTLAILRRLLDWMGIEPERIHFTWLSASEGAKYAEEVSEFVEKVRKLGSHNPMARQGVAL